MTIADRELIDDYLASRLDGAARENVEQRLLTDVGFRREAELTEQLRSGLRQLDSRGELASTAAEERPFWQRPSYALAASVAAALLGIVSLVLYMQLQDSQDGVLARRSGSPSPQVTQPPQSPDPAFYSVLAPRGVRTLAVARTRAISGAPDLTWKWMLLPALLELHVDPGAEPAAAYRVTLEHVVENESAALVQVTGVTPTADGEVLLTVNSAQLPPGDYILRLEPLPSPGEDSATEYRLRVTQ